MQGHREGCECDHATSVAKNFDWRGEHNSAKIQPKNLKQFFDWGDAQAPWTPLVTPLDHADNDIDWRRSRILLFYSV